MCSGGKEQFYCKRIGLRSHDVYVNFAENVLPIVYTVAICLLEANIYIYIYIYLPARLSFAESRRILVNVDEYVISVELARVTRWQKRVCICDNRKAIYCAT